MSERNTIFNDHNSSILSKVLDFAERAENFREERKKFRIRKKQRLKK